MTGMGFRYGFLTLKIASEEIESTLSYVEDEFKKFSPTFAFEYAFLDDRVDRMYAEDRQAGNSFFYFSMVGIIVACFGLFGLATFAAEQRTKEMGIRKVLGASIPGLFLLVTQDVMKWVLAANVIAWPVAYIFMNRWLQHFAYRIDLQAWIFLISAALVAGIALFTVSYRAVKVATTNPVKSLRYE
jgi:putative ABC transport system permease protein